MSGQTGPINLSYLLRRKLLFGLNFGAFKDDQMNKSECLLDVGFSCMLFLLNHAHLQVFYFLTRLTMLHQDEEVARVLKTSV